MWIATTALRMAVASSSCGTLRPRCKSAMARIAATTMKAALRMLLAAITRDRRSRGVRCWISANSGTVKKPPETPMASKSTQMRRFPGARRGTAGPVTAAISWAREVQG